jgi:hypothetical protein
LRLIVHDSSRGSMYFSVNHRMRIASDPPLNQLRTNRRSLTWLTSPSGGIAAPGASTLR